MRKKEIRIKTRGDKVLYLIIREQISSYFELRAQYLSLLNGSVPNIELLEQLDFLDI